MTKAMRLGGHILADQLAAQGARLAFGVPGESYLALLDGLWLRRDVLRFIACRMEAGAANMAVAYGKLTGEAGLCLVTRGPGATHASVGVHTAAQDSVPMILLIGQVARSMRGREAFQEIDYRQFFGGVAKWVDEIDAVERIPEMIARAFAVAQSGRPGPVVLALPEDMLVESAAVEDAPRAVGAAPAPAPAAIAQFDALLPDAQRPVMIVGGPGWNDAAHDALARFANHHAIPVYAGFRSQDAIDNDDPAYAGDLGLGPNPKIIERIKTADLVIAAGTRLEENVSQGYELFELPRPRQTLVHIHPDPQELGRVYQPHVAICSGMENFMRAVEPLACRAAPTRHDWQNAARAEYEAWQQPTAMPGDVNLAEVMAWLRPRLPDDAIICNGAGNYAIWLHRFFRWRRARTQLAPQSGAMGFGLPAAVAASLAAPDRFVLSVNGDGCFLMCGQELATAVQYGARFVALVVNNGLYGTIRMHQEREFPAHAIGTDLRNPDFVALAQAYGARGFRVTKTQDFPATFNAAAAHPGVSLIELVVSPDALTPRLTLSDLQRKNP